MSQTVLERTSESRAGFSAMGLHSYAMNGGDPSLGGKLPTETSLAKFTVLVIDGDVQSRGLLRACLENNGYHVVEIPTGREGIVLAARQTPDVVLLELGLPDMDGLLVLRQLREWSRVPVIVLSARAREEDKVAALDIGADDFVAKPFSVGEVLARLRVAQRRAIPKAESPLFRTGDLQVDLASRTVTLKGRSVNLTATEYSVLRILVRHAGKVLTHWQIVQAVWGPGGTERAQSLRVHIGHLREKLESDFAPACRIVTAPGVGYRLVAKAPPGPNNLMSKN